MTSFLQNMCNKQPRLERWIGCTVSEHICATKHGSKPTFLCKCTTKQPRLETICSNLLAVGCTHCRKRWFWIHVQLAQIWASICTDTTFSPSFPAKNVYNQHTYQMKLKKTEFAVCKYKHIIVQLNFYLKPSLL